MRLDTSIEQILDFIDADNPMFRGVSLLQNIQFKILHTHTDPYSILNQEDSNYRHTLFPISAFLTLS